MKKFLIFILVGVMAMCIFMVGGCKTTTVTPGEKPGETPEGGGEEEYVPPLTNNLLFKFGVMSDSQTRPTGEYNSPSQPSRNEVVEKKLKTFKANDAQFMLGVGDLVNAAETSAYDNFLAIVDKVYPNNSLEMFNVMGNHEYYLGQTVNPQAARAIFEDKFKSKPNYHTVKNGFHFIGISCENDEYETTGKAYTNVAVDYLKAEMAKAQADNKYKPIFVSIHYSDITIHTNDISNNNTNINLLNDVLKSYPQAIVFSGHTHNSLMDERNMAQKDFTAIDVGSSSYTYAIACVNGYIPNNYESNVTGILPPNVSLIVEVYEKEVKFVRYDDNNSVKHSKDWTIDYPIKKVEFKYTNDARIKADGSALDENSLTLTYVTVNKIKVKLLASPDKTLINMYVLVLKNKSTNAIIQKKAFWSEFFSGEIAMPDNYSQEFISLSGKTNYVIEAYAYNHFGTPSAAVMLNVTTK